MIKNICPMCRELILRLDDEIRIRCLKCETIFESKDYVDENRGIVESG